jgi:hypothetical protein
MPGGPVRTRALEGASGATLLWRQAGRLLLTAAVRHAYAVAPDAAMQRAPTPPIDEPIVPYRRAIDVIVNGHAFVRAGDPSAGIRLSLIRAGAVVLAVERRLRPSPPVDAEGLMRATIEGMALPPAAFAVGWSNHQGQPVAEIRSSAEEALQRAPADLRVTALEGDEWLEIAGLHPRLPTLRAQLPKGAAAFWDGIARLRFGSAPWLVRRLALDTLHIDLDAWLCVATWRGWFEIAENVELASAELQVAVRHGADFAWPNDPTPVQRAASAEPRASWDGGASGTTDLTEALARHAASLPALPFATASRSDEFSGTLDLTDVADHTPPPESRRAAPFVLPTAVTIVNQPNEEMKSLDFAASLKVTGDMDFGELAADEPAATPFVRVIDATPPPPSQSVPAASVSTMRFSGTMDLTFEENDAAAQVRLTPFIDDPDIRLGNYFLAALERVRARSARI